MFQLFFSQPTTISLSDSCKATNSEPRAEITIYSATRDSTRVSAESQRFRTNRDVTIVDADVSALSLSQARRRVLLARVAGEHSTVRPRPAATVSIRRSTMLPQHHAADIVSAAQLCLPSLR